MSGEMTMMYSSALGLDASMQPTWSDDVTRSTPPKSALYHSTPQDMAYLVALVVTTMVGNLGNIMVIGAVLSDKRLWKEGNVFILNLAVADLCVTLFVDPFSILGVFVGHEFFQSRDVLCHVIGSVCLVSCVCSLWSIAAISVNRYILLCRPHLYHRVFSWRNSVYIALLLWLGAFFLDLPNFLDWGDHAYDMKTMACSYDRTASYSYTVFFITMFVTIPLFTVLFCNINIYVVVARSKARIAAHTGKPVGELPSQMTTNASSKLYIILDEETSAAPTTTESHIDDSGTPKQQNTALPGKPTQAWEQENGKKTAEQRPQFLQVPGRQPAATTKKPTGNRGKNMKAEVKLAKTLFIVFIVFCVCWTPYGLICLIDRYDRFPKEAYAISILMAHASSTLNSILYAATNKGFREGYKLFLLKMACCCKKS